MHWFLNKSYFDDRCSINNVRSIDKDHNIKVVMVNSAFDLTPSTDWWCRVENSSHGQTEKKIKNRPVVNKSVSMSDGFEECWLTNWLWGVGSVLKYL